MQSPVKQVAPDLVVVVMAEQQGVMEVMEDRHKHGMFMYFVMELGMFTLA